MGIARYRSGVCGLIAGGLTALVALSVGLGAPGGERPVVTRDLPPTADPTLGETLESGVAGISATRAQHELGVDGAGQVIAVFDAGFDLAAIDAVSPSGAVGRLGNLSTGEPRSNTQTGACGSHGSDVAIRAAVTAPAATIVPVVVRGSAECYIGISEDAVRWALGLPVTGLLPNPTPATVLVWSFGALLPRSSPEHVCPLVAKAMAWGAVVVASAGNDATDRAGDFFPAACAGALMIGNSGTSGGREIDGAGYGSNVGKRVDLMVPAPSTSYAAPFAAGVVALVRSVNPSMTAAEAAAVVRGHTQPFQVACTGCGTGILDAYRAVTAARAGDLSATRTVALPAPSTQPLGFHPVVPQRLVDTRATGGRLDAGATRPVALGGDMTEASDAQAAIVNVTATGATESGYLTVYPCAAPRPTTSSVNVMAGGTAAAAVTVQLDGSGSACVFSSTSVDVVVDIAGYFTADPNALTYVADAATPRVLDTRGSSPAVPGAAPIVVPISGASAGDAVTVNVTAIGRGGAGWLALTPCEAAPASAVSNVNVAGAEAVPNQATVRVGAGGAICVTAGEAPIDVLIDVQGRWHAGAGARFVPITPTRVIDSRTSIGVDGAARIAPGMPISYAVPQHGVVALAATVTATDSVRGGYLQVSPCDPVRIAANASSAVNLDGSDGARANGVFAPVDSATGATCITAGPAPGTPMAHVLLDVTGWFVTG